MLTITRMIGLAMVAAATSVAGAQGTVRVSVDPTSRLWVEGTSNVHDWKCSANTINAAIDVDTLAAQLASAPPKMLKKVVVNVPVNALKCGHGKMDDNLRKALNADKNADISFVMAAFEALPSETRGEFTLRVSGRLTVAGIQNAITMDIAATRLVDGTIKAVGAVPVKMTAFGIAPPSALLGTIKTGDEVKVKFELTVGQKVIVAAIERK